MCNIWLLLPLISRKDAKSYYYKLISSLSFQSRANYAQRSLDDSLVNKQKFFSLLSDVWAKLFKSKLWFIDPQPRQQECILECFVEIPIVGSNNFMLVLAMPVHLSYKAAATLFQLTIDELDQDDSNDALNEFGNILAGQVQRTLNEETQLEVPIQIPKEQAESLIENIHPDWEIFAEDEEGTRLYAGVFVGKD